MKQVQKKSADMAANQMITAAYRKQIDLVWDRSESMQPQCGFGRMGICCSDCWEGPCRINPFDVLQRQGICGRTQQDFIKNKLAERVADGVAALAGLAVDFGGELDAGIVKLLLNSDDTMLVSADFDKRMAELGQTAAQMLAVVNKAKTEYCGGQQTAVTDINLGCLSLSAANIVLHGHIAPKTIRLLTDAAGANKFPISLVAMCGSEISRSLNLPVLTNYDSQELPLLTGVVDMLVVGSQCVMPATLSLAEKLGIPTVNAHELQTQAQAAAVSAAAIDAFKRRGRIELPECTEIIYSGYDADNAAPLFAAISRGWAQGDIRGVAYVGGCGNIANTQDAGIIKLAQALIDERYLIFAAGCGGVALAKTDMCKPDYTMPEKLKRSLPAGTPAVIYLGSCQEAGEFLTIARELSKSGVPSLAVLPEITHNKTLATAAAFAAEGIPAYLGLDEALLLPEIKLRAPLLSLAELTPISAVLAEVAAAK